MRSFLKMTRAEFDIYLTKFNWTRRVTAVHMHHTWSPNHAQWQGLKSMRGMYDFHVNNNGWSDIAQHVTIDPEGFIWLGRDWNRSPASSNGYNGTNTKGPFMFETVGNFDKGRDTLEGEQLTSVLHVIAQVQLDRGIETESLKFHRQLGSPKTCPGTSIDYDHMLDLVDAYKKTHLSGPSTSVAVKSSNGVWNWVRGTLTGWRAKT